MTEAFDGFDWDAGNRTKCKKHGVSIAAIESLFSRPIAILADPQHSARETRLKAIGRQKGGQCFWYLPNAGAVATVDQADQRPLHACEGDQSL